MRCILAGTLLIVASSAFAATPRVLDPKNLQTYRQEMNPQAAFDQARRDNGTGLEGPDVGDGWDGSQTARTAAADANNRYANASKGAHNPINGYKGEM